MQNTNHAIAVQRVENLRNKVEAVEAERDEALARVEELKAEADTLFSKLVERDAALRLIQSERN